MFVVSGCISQREVYKFHERAAVLPTGNNHKLSKKTNEK